MRTPRLMTDIVSKEKRSEMMRGIRGKDTRPELVVRRWLHKQGYRFRLHRTDLPGRPDIVLPSRRLAIFVHGCFWHRHPGCRLAYNPKSNVDRWQRKFAENTARDAVKINALQDCGWHVVVVWECQTRDGSFVRVLEHAGLPSEPSGNQRVLLLGCQ